MMKRITLFGFCLLGLMLCSCTPAGTADTTLTPNPATATPIPPSKTPTQALTPTITLTITQTAKVTSTPYPTVEPHEFAITVQNVQEVVQLKELGKNRPHYVAWSPNGAYIATANYSEVTIYATDSLVALQTIDPDQRIESIAFGPDPNKLFIIDQYVHEWDLRTGQEIDIHGYLESGIRNFAVSENGKVITYSGPAWGGGGDPDYVFAIQRVGQVLTGYEQDTKKRNKSIDLLRSDSRTDPKLDLRTDPEVPVFADEYVEAPAD